MKNENPVDPCTQVGRLFRFQKMKKQLPKKKYIVGWKRVARRNEERERESRIQRKVRKKQNEGQSSRARGYGVVYPA